MPEITLGSLFDGIGGFPYAASFCNITSLWASEIVPSCVSVTQKFFPDMAHVGDVTRLDGAKLPPVDIITFGSPCQGLSLAGQRRGLADERSGLFLEAIRIIFEYFGTAQRRRRLFLVCDFGGRRAGEILFVPKSLRRYFETGGTPRQGLTAFAENSAGTAGARRLIPATMRIRCGCEGGGKGPLVQVEKSGTLATRNDQYLFVPQTVEILNDQGGSSLTVERSGLSPTLRSQTHGNLPVVAGMLCMGTSQANASILNDQSPTLTCAHGQAPILVHPQIAGTLCASGAGLNRPAGIKSETDLCVVNVDSHSNRDDMALIVRRLLPIEAERLMGFPDFWTESGVDGKIISDTQRYSMLGNSIAVPCGAYIMQGIRDAMEAV